jgi:fluoride exporter
MGRYTGKFPLATVIVNVTGCFLIGVAMTAITERGLHPNWRLLLVVGFLGGYTTFSSFAWETFASARDGRPWIGLANVLISVTLGYLAVWLGAVSASKR